MAVVFPLLVMVVLGVVQFTLYMHAQNVVTAAAQDGARVAAAQGNNAVAGYRRAVGDVRAGLGAATQPTVTVATLPPGDNPDHVVVTVDVDRRLIIPLGPIASVRVSARAEMSKERFRANP